MSYVDLGLVTKFYKHDDGRILVYGQLRPYGGWGLIFQLTPEQAAEVEKHEQLNKEKRRSRQ